MPTQATANKEKGNAAFKAGKYAEAIGHYTAATLADPEDATFFLNRAAAYLKLSKNEDAERDCTTVLGLSKTNVKALYRRAQARIALQKLGEAHNDLQRALNLEPNNEAVKTELARVDELILGAKKANKPRSVPVQISTPLPAASSPSSSSSTTAPPKRRRIPIAIVDDDTPQSQPPPLTSANTPRRTDSDLLNPISSRTLQPSTSTPPDAKSTPAAPAPAPAPASTAQKSTLPPSSFKEAKQAREVKSVGRVGGGIFRMSGNDTVFKSREVPAPGASPVPPPPTPARAPPPAPAPAPALAAPTPAATPRTLFEFTRSWDRIPTTDTAARWALLNTIHPTSLPALFGASLEPALFASFVPVLAAAPPEQHEAVRAFMCALTRVSRFRTVVQFLSRAERSSARAVWEAVVQGGGDAGADDTEEAARMWGFADA